MVNYKHSSEPFGNSGVGVNGQYFSENEYANYLFYVVSKFKIKELRSKYLFTLIYCFIEKNLLNIKKWKF